jgi:peptidoglycan/xylan/chitin deacetylase (PgdA/CDA1 family)
MPGEVSGIAPDHAFIHVDLDDYWAIAECYGLETSAGEDHSVLMDALPRLRELFQRLEVPATLFAVGKDLEHQPVAEQLRAFADSGHAIANHSYSHNLRFRDLSPAEMESEICQTEELALAKLNLKLRGFRAPGYAASQKLVTVLAKRGYLYDSSLMPSPFGFVFRLIDARLRSDARGSAGSAKTQYPLLADARAQVRPYNISGSDFRRPESTSPATNLVEFPVAAAPLMRLPFQAGVCMRFGRAYFDTLLASFKRSKGPFIFLIHAADACDFSGAREPFFRKSAFFSQPIQRKLDFLEYAIARIKAVRQVKLLEDVLGRSAG